MGIRDRHDLRECGFRHFAKLDADGNVVAIVEVVDQPDAQGTIQQPVDTKTSLHVDVTHLHPYDFSGVKTLKKHVKAGDLTAIQYDLSEKNKVRHGG